MEANPLPVLAGVFIGTLTVMFLVFKFMSINERVLGRLKRVGQKETERAAAHPKAAKKVQAFERKPGTKQEIVFRTLGTDSSVMLLRLRQAGLKMSLLELFIIYLSASIGLAALLVLAAKSFRPETPMLYTALPGVLLGYWLVRFWLKRRIAKRVDAFNNTFPDALDMMVRSLRTGIPISEIFNQVGQDVPDPVGPEFLRIYSDIKFGTPLGQAIWSAAERMPTQEFIFFAISVSIQAETGGNLAENLEKLGGILRNRLQIKRMIKTKSAEARLTRNVLSAMPFLFVGGLYFLSPEYIRVFFEHPTGIKASFIIVGMIATGIYIATKMTKFEY